MDPKSTKNMSPKTENNNFSIINLNLMTSSLIDWILQIQCLT